MMVGFLKYLSSFRRRLPSRAASVGVEGEVNEIRLREELRLAHELLAISPGFAGFLDPRTGAVTASSERSLQSIDARLEDVIGRPFWECAWWKAPAESAAVVRELFAAARDGRTVRADLEYWSRSDAGDPKGEIRWTTLELAPRRDARGVIDRIAATGVDITDRKRAEIELARAGFAAAHERQKMQETLEQTTIPFALLDGPEHRFAFANTSYSRLFNFDESPVGKPVMDVFPDALEQGFKSLLDFVYETGETYSAKEARFDRRHADGSTQTFYLDFTYAAKRDYDDRITGVLAAIVDVTDRVLKRHRVEANEARLTYLLDAIPQVVFLADSEGSITRFSAQWYEYTGGLKNTEAWGWAEAQVIHPDDLQRTIERWTHSLRTGEDYEIDYRLRRADGNYRWHLGRARPVRDDQGRILEWFGTNTEIHDIREIQGKLEAADERLMVALTSGNIGFWDWDAVTGQVSLSANMMESWGIDPALFTRTLDECFLRIHPDDRERVARTIDHSLTNGLGYDIEYRVVRPSGEVIVVNAKGKSFLGPDRKPLRLTGVAIDVTERKKFEKELELARLAAEAANEAKSQFLANMSHEIRTPLGAIMGFADLASQPDVRKTDLDSYLAIINRNSDQVLRIIDDILDLSKVEAGRVSIERVETSLPDFLADFSSLMNFRAKENGIAYFTSVDSPLPERILTDPTRLRQILTNAVGNAIKFTARGRVLLRVSFRDEVLRFAIVDTGRGISPEQETNLFQPFAQADSSTTRKFGGTGLGLVLTRRLCELMGGTYVLAQSELGKGSEFVATVRAETSPGSRVLAPAEIVFDSVLPSAVPTPSVRDQLKDVRLLLVEDSPDNQMLAKLLLTRQGARLDIAGDGAEGYAKARANEYDLVLMDIQMPKMDGHEAMQKLAADGYDKPVIALTAHAMKEEAEKAKQSGFSGYLTKPIQKQDLIATILEHLPKR